MWACVLCLCVCVSERVCLNRQATGSLRSRSSDHLHLLLFCTCLAFQIMHSATRFLRSQTHLCIGLEQNDKNQLFPINDLIHLSLQLSFLPPNPPPLRWVSQRKHNVWQHGFDSHCQSVSWLLATTEVGSVLCLGMSANLNNYRPGPQRDFKRKLVLYLRNTSF